MVFEPGSYTNRATRVIFLARYEAGQYGSPKIGSLHLLLGLVREEWLMVQPFLGQQASPQSIRKAIESRIAIGQRIPVTDEVPFSDECRNILRYAEEEADRRGQRRVDSEHLLLGLLREESCPAAQIFQASTLAHVPEPSETGRETQRPTEIDVRQVIRNMLHALEAQDGRTFSSFFDEDGQFVDDHGQLWIGPKDIERAIASSPYSSKTNPFEWGIEEVKFIGSDIAAAMAQKSRKTGPGHLRITFVLRLKTYGWYAVKAHWEEIISGG